MCLCFEIKNNIINMHRVVRTVILIPVPVLSAIPLTAYGPMAAAAAAAAVVRGTGNCHSPSLLVGPPSWLWASFLHWVWGGEGGERAPF